jgi:hypothetical protein
MLTCGGEGWAMSPRGLRIQRSDISQWDSNDIQRDDQVGYRKNVGVVVDHSWVAEPDVV